MVLFYAMAYQKLFMALEKLFLTGFTKVTANAEKTSISEYVLTKEQYRRIQDWLYQERHRFEGG